MKEYLGKNGLRALVDNVKAWANGAFSARAFAKVKVGSAVVQASNKEDALNLVAGENVTISAQGSSVTISTQGGSCQCGTATTERDGLMSKGDKANLDEVKGWYDTAVGGSEVGSAIDKWHDVTEFLAGISDNDTLKGILDAITREVETLKSDVMTGSVVAGKAEALNVRSAVGGASKPVYLNGNGFAEVCSYDLKDISDVANSAMAKANAAYVKPSGGIPKTDLASGVQESLNKADGAQPLIDDLDIIRTRASNGNSAFTDLYNGMYAKNADLAKVAKSGSYTDLTNKPSIPAAVNESTVSGWGFTKNTGTYSKPSGGIPKTDLASGVQESLNKADSAYVLTAQGIMRNELNSAITDELDSKLEAKDVGNGTITLNGSDGSTIGSFKTNQASNTAITIPVTSVSNSGATLSWGEAITLAKVNGTAITAKLPSNPAKTYKAGEGLYESTANTFAVNAATTSAMGGMKVGYAANGKKYPVSIDSEGKAFVEVPWSADGGNAAKLGDHDGAWYRNNTLRFTRFYEFGADGKLDLNSNQDGCVYNYTGPTRWKNAPDDMSYGQVLNFSSGEDGQLSGQLAWDVQHASKTDTTRFLWWRSNDETGFANSKWHKIPYTDTPIPDSTSGSKGVSVKLSGTVGEPKLLTTVISSGVTSTSETVVLGKEVAAALGGYLPLSGGTITSKSNTILTLKGTEGSYYAVQYFYIGDSPKGFIGWNKDNGLCLYNATSEKYLGIRDDGVPIFGTNILLHSGNVWNYALSKIGARLNVTTDTTTFAELKEQIKDWLNKVGAVVGAWCSYDGAIDRDAWNSGTVIGGGGTVCIIITSVASWGAVNYVQLRITTYDEKEVYYTAIHNGNFRPLKRIAFGDNTLSAQSNNGGVKVQLGGTIGTPTLTVTTTTGGVSSSNQGIVSGSEVFGFVKDSKMELKKADGGIIGTFTTNQAQGTAITFNNASTSSAGLMSASDKTKLNSAVTGSGVTSIQVVSALPNNTDRNTLYVIK